jgi:hypothetical protein
MIVCGNRYFLESGKTKMRAKWTGKRRLALTEVIRLKKTSARNNRRFTELRADVKLLSLLLRLIPAFRRALATCPRRDHIAPPERLAFTPRPLL